MQKKYQILLLLVFAILVFRSVGAQEITTSTTASVEIPWGWYVSRMSGLLGFFMLYLSIFLGLTIRIPFFRKIFSPLYALDMHCWISVQALLLVLVHGVALMFDKFLHFGFVDVFIPFASSYQTNFVALGIIGFYLLSLIVVTSYGRKYISPAYWRVAHSLNVGLYIVVIIHALYLGTDLKDGLLRSVFIWANAVLVILFAYNILLRLVLMPIRQKKAQQFSNNEVNRI